MNARRIEVVGVRGHANWRRLALVLAAQERAEVTRLEGPAEEVGPKAKLLPEICRCGMPDGMRGVVVGVGLFEFRCKACLGLHSSAWVGP